MKQMIKLFTRAVALVGVLCALLVGGIIAYSFWQQKAPEKQQANDNKPLVERHVEKSLPDANIHTAEEEVSAVTEELTEETELTESDNETSEEVISESVARTEDYLYVHFIDVGEGDAALLQYKDYNIVVDCGDASHANQVVSYLQKQQVEQIDYLILSVISSEHIGGTKKIIEQFPVGTVFVSPYNADGATMEELGDALQKKGHTRVVPQARTGYELEELSFAFLGTSDSKSKGDSSLITMFYFGENRFCFMGDLSENGEKALVQNANMRQADVIKVANHGNKNSTSMAFLNTLQPTYAVISSGENNLGNPSQEVIDRLKMFGASIYRTDEQGTIVAYSDGKNIRFENSPTQDLVGGTEIEQSTIDLSDATSSPRKANRINDAIDEGQTFVLNKESGIYHMSGCQWAAYIPEDDREETMQDINQIEALGFQPCIVCVGE